MARLRVLLADDHALFRGAVASLLAHESDFEVIGEARDGRQALALAREWRPDVVLMDLFMPGMDGLEATRRIKAELPQVKVVILSVSQAERSRSDAVASGADGYLSKLIEPRALYGALRRVVQLPPVEPARKPPEPPH